VKQQLEALVTEMVDRGILFAEAKREFEKGTTDDKSSSKPAADAD